jgi:type I restriction enzyme S subunit
MSCPKLRFKDAEGKDFPDWNFVQMKEICKINQGLQIPISSRFGEYGPNRFFYITNEFLREGAKKKYFIENPSPSVICTDDDVLMTRTGNTGKVVTGVSGAFHNNFFKINYDRNLLNKGFLVEFLSKKETQSTILKLAGTSTIPDLNHSDFYAMKVPLPILAEQKKISSFLSRVDQKIFLLIKKHELLVKYKKGVIQKIFNQGIRFKDSGGRDFPDWAEYALGDIGEIITGKTPKTDNKDLWGGDIQFVTPTDIKDSKYQNQTARYVTKNQKLKTLPKNSIMFTCIASIGKMALSTQECITNQQINSIVPNENFDSEYIYYALLNIVDYIRSTKSSSTLPIINKSEFSKFIIGVPSKNEQQLISNFLSVVDKKIEVIQSQIKLSMQYKQGLLQQIFI